MTPDEVVLFYNWKTRRLVSCKDHTMTPDDVRMAIRDFEYNHERLTSMEKMILFLAQRELERMEAGTDEKLIRLLEAAQYARGREALREQDEYWKKKNAERFGTNPG